MPKRKQRMTELFGEISDSSGKETLPFRDRPSTLEKKLTLVPRVGTVTQRGSRETARRNAAIVSPPPPLLTRRRTDGPAPRGGVNVANGGRTDVTTILGRPHRHRDECSRGCHYHSRKHRDQCPATDRPLEDGGRPAPWRASLRPAHHPSELSCRPDVPWTTPFSPFTAAGSTNSGSPAIAG